MQALQASLKAALQLEGGAAAHIELSRVALADPELFFQAGFKLLESLPPSSDRAKMYGGLLGCPAFLIELTRKERFSHRKLVRICQSLAAVDNRLDIRLAHLLPGRAEDLHGLEVERLTRILDVLNEISVGPRLIFLISHLTAHPHPDVAERATLLIGRRIRNFGWMKRRLESGGPEIRTGVVQGLWGIDTPEARRTMRTCLKDTSERVAGSAVFGLHLLKEADVPDLVDRMLADERPAFRATAAWLAGQIGGPAVTAVLQRAKDDTEPSVRLAAKRAMVSVRRSAAAEQTPVIEPALAEPAKEIAAAEPQPAKETIAAEPKKKPAQQLRIRLDGTSASTRWG